MRVAADAAGASHGPPSSIEIVLPGEQCVRVFGPVDRQALADVLAVVRLDDAVADWGDALDAGTGAC